MTCGSAALCKTTWLPETANSKAPHRQTVAQPPTARLGAAGGDPAFAPRFQAIRRQGIPPCQLNEPRSPSLGKMGYSRTQYSRNHRISFGNIIGDPFALATISTATVSLNSCPSRGAWMTDLLTRFPFCSSHGQSWRTSRSLSSSPLHVLGVGLLHCRHYRRLRLSRV